MEDFADDLPPESESISEELSRLARETIEAQSGMPDMAAARERCRRVIDLYTQGALNDGRDFFHAAWVLLGGETQAHYNLSRELARMATDLGEARAWTLRAMAWDRWLVARGVPQRFGTQIIKKDGIWSLGQVDPQVSDLDRALYAVPPLYMQRQRAEQLQSQEDRDR
jgi:hypothetical protein